MAKLFDNVGQVTATTGTGTVTLGAVITDSTNGDYVSFQSAGAAAGDVVYYLIKNGTNGDREEGTGTLGGTGPGFTLTRTVVQSTIGGTVGTTAVTLAGTSNVYCVPLSVSLVTTGGLAQAFTGGIRPTAFDLGTVSSGTTTPDSGNGPIQKLTNNGAFTLAAPVNDGGIDLMITNGASAGAITFSGFTKALTGDTYATTNTNKFLVVIRRINSISFYQIQAMQ